MKRIGILTSGGDAPGMNAAVRSAVRTGISMGMEVYGIKRGYEGLLDGEIERMQWQSVGDILQRGGTILRAARSERFRTEEGRKHGVNILETFGIEGLVVIGGDGSFRGGSELAALGITPKQLDAVILTHLDCDHVSGLKDLKGAKHIYATKEELEISLLPNPRYRKALWQGVEIEPIEMNYDSRAPFGKSCDLFGDGSVRIVYTPGHSAGSVCVVIKQNGKMAVIAGDNGISEKSWSELILSGPIHNIQNMKISLRWLNKMYKNENCVAVLTAHDKDYKQTKIEF